MMREKLPRVSSVRALKDMRLALRFDDGWKPTVALKGLIDAFASLAPLRDTALFAQVQLEQWGSGVTWDEEGTLSIAATTLYRLAAEQSGTDAQRFDAWMMLHGLSATRAAACLGMSRRSIIHYRTGARPVPRYVALACKGWEAEQRARPL